jgi:ABC-type multidrug transport system fused ATPase/permease subunit
MPPERAEPSDAGRLERGGLRRVVALLYRFCVPHRRTFVLIALLAALSSMADVAAPLIYRTAVNDLAGVFVHRAHQRVEPTHRPRASTAEPHGPGYVAPRTNTQAIRSLLAAVLALLVVKLVTQSSALAADSLMTRVGSQVEGDLIHATFGRLLRFPLAFFARRPSGALAKQVNQTDQVVPIVAAFSKDVLPEAFRAAGIVTVMLAVNPPLALVALSLLPAYLWVSYRMKRTIERGLDDYYDLWDEVSARMQDALAGVKTVKLSGAEEREARRLRHLLRAAYAAYVARNRTENRYMLGQTLISQTGRALVLAYGGLKVFAHQLTPGDVVMFVAYLDKLFEPLDALTQLWASLQQNFASVGRAVRLLHASGTESGGIPLPSGAGRIEFRDVRFGYRPDREVLRGVSFTVEAGSVTALVGPSGTGKTTTMDLLLRLYEPTGGEILIDGAPLATVDPAAARAAIGVVSTEGAVFRGTLAENVRYKRPEASDEEVREAVLAAGLGRAVERLPQGLDSEIGEGGVGLSVGERQRLQIARALLARPRILILDEATANLDFATEAEVKRAFEAARGRRTVVVVAHRYSMVAGADRVIVLETGRVTQTGTVAELSSGDGWFARFARRAARTEA